MENSYRVDELTFVINDEYIYFSQNGCLGGFAVSKDICMGETVPTICHDYVVYVRWDFNNCQWHISTVRANSSAVI